MKKIVFTGGSGRFAQVFKKVKHKYKILYPSKNQLDIENYGKIIKFLEKSKPNYLIHCAALSRPMKIHEKNIFDIKILKFILYEYLCFINNC